MSKFLPVVLVVVFSLICLSTALLMPWAELGFPEPLPELTELRQALAVQLPGACDPQVFVYYVYSFFLGLALLSAAMGLWLEGREDSEEKTILPVKK